MCIIIVKQKDKRVSEETLKNASRINPHNLGVVWLDTFEVTYHKSKDYKVLNTNRPYIAHFRYATIGEVNKQNTHPFVCGNNKNELLMMNGTIWDMGNEKMSDTKMLAHKLGNIGRHKWKSELSKYSSRFTTINKRTRTYQIYNKELWTNKDGVWYSKDNVLQDTLIGVYGTLKRNYSNHHHYLNNAKFIGSGETKDKYPLVIQGLPYMVNKRGVGHNVEIEVFKICGTTFAEIDKLEGHPQWYKREIVPIRMSDGRVLNVWLYFNKQLLTKNTTLHKTYTPNNLYNNYGGWSNRWKQKTYNSNQLTIPTMGQRSINSFKRWRDNYNTIEVDREDDVFNDNDLYSDTKQETKPYCIDCYHDLESDGFGLYHCDSCGGWFGENEVLTDCV